MIMLSSAWKAECGLTDTLTLPDLVMYLPNGLFQIKDLARRYWSVGWVSFQWKSEHDGCCMPKCLSV